MAGDPSSSHRGEHREHREHRHRSSSSHHHHRTISSTTLLLVLSLVLAVLAVMLSLPSGTASSGTSTESGSSVLSYLTPKRTQALIARESAVAVREAEVARREAEVLIGAPGGVIPSPASCAPCTAATTFETITAPAATIIKEIVKEDSLTPPGWTGARAEELLERELKITERERDISKREENVNRREHDAARRESWIMEQLISLGNDNPQTVEEEYVYEPSAPKRKAPKYQELPIVAETIQETLIMTETITVPAPASTRPAAKPSPVSPSQSKTDSSPRTTEVEIVTEYEEPPSMTVARPRATRPNARWFGGGW
ncbi:hypothetical protein AGABI1DRAFT_97635 [Agaricus bisporus var. burnettii JB137-S8]|nr:hypothetical protein AGABI2DRAFT_64829 [Agaricus bisporus var. bisporus H97]XP_007326632.1 uncharacterized protein AGABI1DRAFT_97635 [Agaricus bisporus var. burnettii JB137-S8]EKM82676.1 hypothetical protein AGABI1DRAFT_97635 [Agaricus bisporus var. burnettii JB137-S8]EKV50076.1 hypothetical protein AGABI2DRAFT_64829 [Agaricus bisporus var. bisporus H97]